MHDLVKLAVEAHGGLARWKQLRAISATMVADGPALQLEGRAAFANGPVQVTVDTRIQRTTFEPFPTLAQRGVYEPGRAAVETVDGTLLEELKNPRDSFTPRDPRWSAPQLAYFAGYAMWTYLTLPFSLLTDGVECEEIESRVETDETWRALKVTFPPSYVTQSVEQVLYFDGRGLIRRQDYSVDVAGGTKVTHYLDEHLKFGGIFFPTRCRVYPCGADGNPDKSTAIVTAELADFKFAADVNQDEDDVVDFRSRFMAGIYEC
jgi:hypothetical protein